MIIALTVVGLLMIAMSFTIVGTLVMSGAPKSDILGAIVVCILATFAMEAGTFLTFTGDTDSSSRYGYTSRPET